MVDSGKQCRPSYFGRSVLVGEGTKSPVKPREPIDPGPSSAILSKAIPGESKSSTLRDPSAVRIVEEAIEVGAKAIWMQLGGIHNEAPSAHERRARSRNGPLHENRARPLFRQA